MPVQGFRTSPVVYTEELFNPHLMTTYIEHKETRTTEIATPHAIKIRNLAYQLIYVVLYVVEAVLLLRFLFKLLGANPFNGLVAMLYQISLVFLAPFAGMFPAASVGPNMVFEPSVLVAMAIYAIIAYVIVLLIKTIERSAAV